ncbi:MAG: cytochrome P450 [Pseudomonadota bacterium]
MDMRLPVSARLPRQPLGLIESYFAARRNVLEIIPEAALYEDVIAGRTGPQRWMMVMAPKAIRRVLLEAVEDYPKSEATKSILRPAIGNSMFIAEGDEWRWQRRAAAPAFAARKVSALIPIMAAAADAAAERIGPAAGKRAVNVHDEMVAATLDVIADVTFGEQGVIDKTGVTRSMEVYIDQAARISFLDVLGLPDWVPRPARTAAAAGLAEMQAAADAAIARRRRDGPRVVPDLLDLMRGAKDAETGREIGDAELRENLLTFIAAGHETTAVTLAWALYLMAAHPEMQDRAAAEAASALDALRAGEPDAAPFVRQVVEETLRLYPPGAFLSRTARAEDSLAGAEVRPGDTVMIPVYALHRHRKLWSDPDAFFPDRFADSRPQRYSYLPFSDGPRICIGARFALQEAVVVLATLLSRFRFTPVKGRAPKPVMILSLRPEGGVWLETSPR